MIQGSDSYSSLLWGTMASILVSMIFYLLQPVKNGKLVFPDLSVLTELIFRRKSKSEDAAPPARFLLTVHESVESVLYGMARIFPALIILTLAWASGTIMTAVGTDRLFSSWIVGGINPEALPTLSFLISLFMALATGTSWGTMSILFPLILVPTYYASNGNQQTFYATVAGVLSGSVAGDHASPISDTTVLSALACDCKLLAHVSTQAPYAVVTILISILVGTVPIGYDAWPNIIGILIGACVTLAFIYLVCAPVISPSGKYDLVTELLLRFKDDSYLHQLKEDTVKAYNGTLFLEENDNMPEGNAKKLESSSDQDEDVIFVAKDEDVDCAAAKMEDAEAGEPVMEENESEAAEEHA